MSGQATMYALKPIVSLPGTLHHTKTMYEMRNIHEENRPGDDHTAAENEIVPDITEQVISFLKSPLPEFVALEARQEKILVQLAELKKQVSTIRDFLKQTNQVALTDNSKTQEMSPKTEPVNVKLIINVNPKRPPYSLLALKKVWNDTDFRVQTFVHSSVTGEVPAGYETKNNSAKDNVIDISLIWKDVKDLELVSGLCSYPLIGEVNFLRYASRLLNTHNYENSACMDQVRMTDTVLDLCHCLIYEETQKRKQEMLSSIADKINCNWTGKEEPSIADIAAWSIIKQVFPNKYPAKFNQWFKTCEKHFL